MRLENSAASYITYALEKGAERRVDMGLDVQKLYGKESPSQMLSLLEDLPA